MAFTMSVAEVIAADTTGLLAKHDSWERVPLAEVAKILNGAPFDSSLFGSTLGIPLVRIRDVLAGETTTFYMGTYDDVYLVKQGDLLIGMDGDFNRGCWGSQLAVLNQRVCKVASNDLFYDKRFLAYVLPGYLAAINANTPSVTVKHLSSKTIGEIDLPLPPRAEQTRIVAKLEELLSDLDAGVAELKAAQKKLQQYRQSLLKAAVEGALTASWRETQRTANTPLETGAELLERILRERRAYWEEKQLAKFKKQGKTPPKDWQNKYPEPVSSDTTSVPALPEGWVWASMDQLSNFVRNGISKTPNTNNVGYPILRINAVRPMSVSFNEIKNIDLVADEAADYFIENGDLLATRYNGSVDLLGVVGLVRNPPSEMLHPDKLIRMKPVVEGALGLWIEIAANTSYSRKHIVRRVKTTAGQTGISGEDLKKMPIPLPPLTEQSILAELVSRQLAALIEQHSAVERALKQSAAQRRNLLRAAFAGQLVPQDTNDEPASMLLERIRSERAAQAATKKPRGRKTEKAAA